MPSSKKIDSVSSLVEKLQKSPNFVVVDFDSATHQKMEEVRRTLFEKAARIEVIKNSLFKIALSKIGKKEMGEGDLLKGSSAIVTMQGDWSETLSTFFKSVKADELFTFKAGVLDGVVYTKDALVKLAQLPSRGELIAKIISSFKSPQSRLVYTMNFGMTKFINVLKQKSTQGGEQ